METVRLRIRGRVQGVSFRVWLRRKALEAGIDGWVRNRRDGSVEAVLRGATVEPLIRLCHEGPPGARVEAVEKSAAEEAVATGFVVLHDA